MYICEFCGSTDVLLDAWYDPNAEEVANVFDEGYCVTCDGVATIVELLLPTVVGKTDDECAWCMDKPHTKAYQATDSQNEQVLYLVCDECYDDFKED
jgi:hypothetical protein